MSHKNIFLRIAAFSAMLTAVTTFLLWILPKLYTVPPNIEERVELYKNTFYMTRLWVNFIHIPLALMGYFGLAIILYNKQKIAAVFGMLWFTIWGTIEMIGVSIIIFSVNYNWRKKYESADLIQKSALKNNMEAYSSIWDSMFFVLLVAFLIATILFAWATWRSKGLEKVLSYLLWLAVPLTILIMLGEYANQNWANAISDKVYPFLQPVSRFVLGIYLWSSIEKSTIK